MAYKDINYAQKKEKGMELIEKQSKGEGLSRVNKKVADKHFGFIENENERIKEAEKVAQYAAEYINKHEFKDKGSWRLPLKDVLDKNIIDANGETFKITEGDSGYVLTVIVPPNKNTIYVVAGKKIDVGDSSEELINPVLVGASKARQEGEKGLDEAEAIALKEAASNIMNFINQNKDIKK